jgi:hypothetical protein
LASVVIENPLLNSPFGEPAPFHEFDKYGTPTGRILEGRRKSGYFDRTVRGGAESGADGPRRDSTGREAIRMEGVGA